MTSPYPGETGSADDSRAPLLNDRTMSAGNARQSFASTRFPNVDVLPDEMTTEVSSLAADDVHAEDEKFHRAAARGQVDVVKRLVSQDTVSCDAIDQFGKTALHWGSQHGHSDVVQQLLSAGATVDSTAKENQATPLMLAALAGHAEVVRILLAAGAGARDRMGTGGRRCSRWRSTALHYAARGGQVEVVTVLLDAGFDKCQRDGAGLTPVEVAARKASAVSPTSSKVRAATTFRLLPKDRGGPLVHSYVNMVMEDFPMIQGLAKGGAFLDWQDRIGDSPLHLAAHFRHVRVTQALLEAGAETDLRNHRGASPLHVAASTGRVAIVSMLLKAGAETESRMVNGRSPLHLAVINDNPDVVKTLLQTGACTEHRDHGRGQTPLSEAAEYGLAHIVHILLESREGESAVDVETRSSAGLTPLHFACRFNSPDSVDALLSVGADPDAVDFAAAAAASRLDSLATKSTTAGSVQSARSSVCSKDELGVVSCHCKSRPPVADDVIGFGDPSKWTENHRRDFIGETILASRRRRNPVSADRIRVLLHRARRGKAWRRRGWLVVLAARLEIKETVDQAERDSVTFHAQRNLSVSNNVDIETEVREDEIGMWGIQALEGTEQRRRGAEAEGRELDIDDDPCTSVCGRFEGDEQMDGSASSVSEIKWRGYAGPGTKRRHEVISASLGCREHGSVNNTSCAVSTCYSRIGDRYGDNDVDEMLFGEALDSNMLGSALIQRLVALAGVEMGVFRRVVCFI